MKIAVLFTSANPLTNAHVSAMKTAVKAIGADLGLYVATNGQYLKRKTVKIDAPFYLSEDERKAIIENICDSEPNLEFWGFEMGGSTPKRYKTLAKIQKQYPDATIYEVQGADKVRSISKFGDSEDYVKNVRFAIFDRDGIDLDSLIDTDHLLSAHKDRFTLLPALDVEAEISSTEVRRRFFAGEDFSDLVPYAVFDAMSKYKPLDFTISFTERMQTLLKSGRFGVNAAQKEVYADHNKLFALWKNGENEAYFGNYREFLDNTVLYKTAFDVSDKGEVYSSTETGTINMDCVDLAEHLIKEGYNPAILNLASAKHPCGGYAQGLSAQEESLCRSSNLSVSLFQYGDVKYKDVRESCVSQKELGYPMDINYGGIYTPNVTFFRYGKSELYDFRIPPFRCDVISVAGLSFNGRSHYADVDELSYRSENGGFTPEGEEIMLNKIRTIFRLGIEHGKDALVLGALSCGAYKCPPEEVSRQFRAVMEEPEFKNKFRLIIFAILERPRRPQGIDGRFAPFYQEFGRYTVE